MAMGGPGRSVGAAPEAGPVGAVQGAGVEVQDETADAALDALPGTVSAPSRVRLQDRKMAS